MWDWEHLPPEVRDFLIRLLTATAGKSARQISAVLLRRFREVVGEPSARVEASLRQFVDELEGSATLSLLQKLRRPSAEDQHLLVIANFFNALRRELVRRDCFLYLAPSFADPTAVMLLQTPRAYLSRDRIDHPGRFQFTPDLPLKKTQTWRIERPAALRYGDFRGVKSHPGPAAYSAGGCE